MQAQPTHTAEDGGPGWPLSPPRHELKYAASSSLAPWLEHELRGLADPDGEHPENTIHSVYIDTPSLRDYRDSTDGQFVRSKTRLRWYSQSQGDPEGLPGGDFWLECKHKDGPLGRKSRRHLTLDPAPSRDEAMAALQSVIDRELGPGRVPVCRVSYHRRRYLSLDGRARIALDTDIRARWLHPLRAAPGAEIRWPHDAVLEVKGSAAAAPAFMASLPRPMIRQRSFSKYQRSVHALLRAEPCSIFPRV